MANVVMGILCLLTPLTLAGERPYWMHMLLELIGFAACAGGLVGFDWLHWSSCDDHGALWVAMLHLAF